MDSGSVPMPRIAAAIMRLLDATVSQGFLIATHTLPLSAVERCWIEAEGRAHGIYHGDQRLNKIAKAPSP